MDLTRENARINLTPKEVFYIRGCTLVPRDQVKPADIPCLTHMLFYLFVCQPFKIGRFHIKIQDSSFS